MAKKIKIEANPTINKLSMLIVASVWVVIVLAYRFTIIQNETLINSVDASAETSLVPILSGDLIFFLNLLLAVSTSVLGGMAFSFVQKSQSNGQLDDIRAIAKVEYTEQLLSDLSHYDGRYCEDFVVHSVLKNYSASENLLFCDIEYSYKKSKTKKNVTFTFHRIHDATNKDSVPEIFDECMENEFVWFNDETDMIDKPKASDYRVTGLSIGTTDGTKKVELKIIEESDDKVVYGALLDVPLSEIIQLSYKVSFPVERQSIIVITTDFPTLNAQFTMDYTQICHNTELTAFANTGVKNSPIAFDDETGKVSHRHSEWLSPKDGFTYAWWKND